MFGMPTKLDISCYVPSLNDEAYLPVLIYA